MNPAYARKIDEARSRVDEGTGWKQGEVEIVPLPAKLRISSTKVTTPMEKATRELIRGITEHKEFGAMVEDAEVIDNQIILYCNVEAANRFDDLVAKLQDKCGLVELLAKPGDAISESSESRLFIFLLEPNLAVPSSEPSGSSKKAAG